MIRQIKKSWQEFKESTPGNRFQEHYRVRQEQRRSPIKKVLFISLGLLIMLAGVVLLAIPGPGLLVIFLGAGFLAEESLFVARALDWIEVRARRLLDWARRTWRSSSLILKALIVGGTAALVGAAGYGGYLVFFPT